MIDYLLLIINQSFSFKISPTVSRLNFFPVTAVFRP